MSGWTIASRFHYRDELCKGNEDLLVFRYLARYTKKGLTPDCATKKMDQDSHVSIKIGPLDSSYMPGQSSPDTHNQLHRICGGRGGFVVQIEKKIVRGNSLKI